MADTPDPIETTVVGNYPSEDEAQRAREHLTAVGVEPVGIREVSSDVWEVEVPTTQRERALEELRRMEQEAIRRFF